MSAMRAFCQYERFLAGVADDRGVSDHRVVDHDRAGRRTATGSCATWAVSLMLRVQIIDKLCCQDHADVVINRRRELCQHLGVARAGIGREHPFRATQSSPALLDDPEIAGRASVPGREASHALDYGG